MIGVSPTRPGNLPVMPPVEVAAARSPRQSRATAPTVPCRRASSSSATLPAQSLLQGAPARLGMEIAGLGEGEPLLAGQRQRALADQQHVRRVLHDGPRRQHRVSRSEDAGDGTGPPLPPFHHRGVHFLGAGGGEHGAAAGIEQRVVLERDDGGGHRVERGAAGGENVAARHQGAAAGPRGTARRGPGSSHRAAASRRRHAPPARIRWSSSQALGHCVPTHGTPATRLPRHAFALLAMADPETVIASEAKQSGAVHAALRRNAPWLRLVLLGLGISVVPLDTSVNIAFPEITGSFGLPIAMIQWVVICYVLTHAGLMLACGRIGDMWGHARVFRAGLVVEHRRVPAVRRRAELRLAAVLPVSARHQRRAHPELRTRAGDKPLPGGAAQPCARHVHVDVRDRVGRRAADRRVAGSALGLAGGVLVPRSDCADKPVVAARPAARHCGRSRAAFRHRRRGFCSRPGLAALLLGVNGAGAESRKPTTCRRCCFRRRRSASARSSGGRGAPPSRSCASSCSAAPHSRSRTWPVPWSISSRSP